MSGAVYAEDAEDSMQEHTPVVYKHHAVAGLQALLEKMLDSPCFDEDDISKVREAIANDGQKLEECLELKESVSAREAILEDYVDAHNLNEYFPHLVNDLTQKGLEMLSLAENIGSAPAPGATPSRGARKR